MEANKSPGAAIAELRLVRARDAPGENGVGVKERGFVLQAALRRKVAATAEHNREPVRSVVSGTPGERAQEETAFVLLVIPNASISPTLMGPFFPFSAQRNVPGWKARLPFVIPTPVAVPKTMQMQRNRDL